MSALNTSNFEMFNAAVHSAIQGLGEVIGEPLEFTVQDVCVLESNDVATLFSSSTKFGVVKDKCSGLLNAEMLLLFDVAGVFCILQKMLGTEADEEMIRECENEAMCELGNIMIIRCLSSIADFLHTPLESTLPSYDVKSNIEIVTYIKNAENSDVVFVSNINLTIQKQTIESKILFVMNNESFRNMT